MKKELEQEKLGAADEAVLTTLGAYHLAKVKSLLEGDPRMLVGNALEDAAGVLKRNYEPLTPATREQLVRVRDALTCYLESLNAAE